MAPFQSTPDNGQIQAAVSDRLTGEGFRALLTLPDVLLATAPPDFSVLAPSYASAQEVSVIDITPDSHIFYTTDGTDPTADSKPYRKSMVIDKTTTIKAIAIGGTGYASSVISSAPYTIAVPEYPLPSIDLTANDDTCPFGSMFRSPRLGGINGLGKAIAADVLGSSLNWGSSEFLFGVPDTSNGTANATIHFVPGYYRTVNVLATGLRGDHPNEKFTVTYSDGSSETTSIAMSDWATRCTTRARLLL